MSHTTKPAFEDVQMGPADPMFLLKAEFDADKSPKKVDLGAGVLRGERGACYELPVIRQAKDKLERKRLGHDYRPTTGIASLTAHAAGVMFSENNSALKEERIASIQTVAGTGACRIGAVFLEKHWPSTSLRKEKEERPMAYVGTPTWGNYEPLFKHAGFTDDFKTYPYLDAEGSIDMTSTLKSLRSAPDQSIFIFQACCHNPTGRDFDQNQWIMIAEVMQERGHFAFFDAAYQGLGHDLSQDAWAVRYFTDRGINMLVCQSFSKNAGLYSERVGVLHVVCASKNITVKVLDTLRSLVRWEVSSAPAYGAELVNTVLEDPEYKAQWQSELGDARKRLRGLRQAFYRELTFRGTPSPRTGSVRGWDQLLQENGLFSFTGLSAAQARRLIDEHHIYLPGNGRINVSGLNEENMSRVADAFYRVIKD